MSSYEASRLRFTNIARAELHTVASADDVSAVVERMRNDLHEHPGEWENYTLESFLYALAACLRAQRQLYTNLGEQYPATAEWRFFAEALVAATGYE